MGSVVFCFDFGFSFRPLSKCCSYCYVPLCVCLCGVEHVAPSSETAERCEYWYNALLVALDISFAIKMLIDERNTWKEN